MWISSIVEAATVFNVSPLKVAIQDKVHKMNIMDRERNEKISEKMKRQGMRSG